MKIVGIIAEYNPFHNGHALHIAATRQATACDCVVAVMSGSFVQRGEPAMFDKWSRAAMAVSGGADVVIELPFVFSVRSAQYFAAGGVRLLSALGADYLSFGAETADLAALQAAARASEVPTVNDALQRGLNSGMTYAKALADAVQAATGLSAEVVASPNNILAIEYLRAINRYCPQGIRPLAVQRLYADFHDTVIGGEVASATAIRRSISTSSSLEADVRTALPTATATKIAALLAEGQAPITAEAFDTLLLGKLRTSSLDTLASLPEISEGLEYRIADCALKANNSEELFSLIKSKRYPRTRLQRMAIHLLVGTSAAYLRTADDSGPLYARVLAFNETGRKALRRFAQNAAIPVITKTASALKTHARIRGNLSPLQDMLAYDTYATDIHMLGMPNPQYRKGGRDFSEQLMLV